MDSYELLRSTFKSTGRYNVGQDNVARSFGIRGVIVIAWNLHARLADSYEQVKQFNQQLKACSPLSLLASPF